MHVIRGRNVNDIYRLGRSHLKNYGLLEGSRNSEVLVTPYPVMSIYSNPTERVLFDETRDANPFFHLMESLWMLAGREDAEFLNFFVKDFGSRYAEAGGNLWGAYGYRWRKQFEDTDQLPVIIRRLKKYHQDRRVVLTMWTPTLDLWDPKRLNETEPKDLPCNTHAYPRIVEGRLDLTILCRSNDIIWGAYGANAVHFSVLQEYLAAGIGVPVGTLYQFSNNFHGYTNIFTKTTPPGPGYGDPYSVGQVSPLPIVTNFDEFDRDLREFMADPLGVRNYANSFFKETAWKMYLAYDTWKTGDRGRANEIALTIEAMDWRIACCDWFRRRTSK